MLLSGAAVAAPMPGAQLRLLPGGSGADGALVAGIEIAMERGAKTYWRVPGDSGVPPRFDWSGSSNIGEIEVRFPAPHRFSDGSGTSIGYAERVVLPVVVKPKDPQKPVELRLSADFAICERLCVPISTKAQVRLSPGQLATELVEALERVPKAMAPAGGLKVESCRVDRTMQPARIEVTTRGRGPLDLFAEGPSEDYVLPVPQPQDEAGGEMQRFSFAFDGVPAGVHAGTVPLKLTLVSPEAAIETQACLDPADSRAK